MKRAGRAGSGEPRASSPAANASRVLRDAPSLPTEASPFGRELSQLPPIRSRSLSGVPGSLHVGEKLGEGAHAIVHATARPDVAIKIAKTLDGNALIDKDAAVLGAVRHAGLPTYYGHGRLEGGRAYVLLEKVSGRSWTEAYGETPVATVGEAVRMMGQVLAAANTMHRAGFVHGDIRPKNVMQIGDSGRVKLLDFGDSGQRTAQGVATDLYDAAATLVFLLTGRPCGFEWKTWKGVLQLNLLEGLAGIRGGGLDLEQVLRRALTANPSDATRAFAQLTRELSAFESVGALGPARPSGPPRPVDGFDDDVSCQCR